MGGTRTCPRILFSLLVVVARDVLAANTRYLRESIRTNPNLSEASSSTIQDASPFSTSTCDDSQLLSNISPNELHRSWVASRLSSMSYFMDRAQENGYSGRMSAVNDTYTDQNDDTFAAYESLFLFQRSSTFAEEDGPKRSMYLESSDGVDAVYLINYDNQYCMAVFRGTEANMFQNGRLFQDWISNIDMEAVEIPNTSCQVHRGYYNAYHNFDQLEQVEQFLLDCQQECPDCEVVLTGHSQGGSIATIAAIELLQSTPLNPYVITFGAPQGLGAGCLPLVNALSSSCRWYHYIMSVDGHFGLTYDIVPMVFPTLLKGRIKYDEYGFGFVGHELLLSNLQLDSLVYIGRDVHQFGMPYSDRAHDDGYYSGVLQAMVESSSNIPTTGFQDGALCNRHDECRSKKCEKDAWWDWKPRCLPVYASAAVAMSAVTNTTYENGESLPSP